MKDFPVSTFFKMFPQSIATFYSDICLEYECHDTINYNPHKLTLALTNKYPEHMLGENYFTMMDDVISCISEQASHDEKVTFVKTIVDSLSLNPLREIFEYVVQVLSDFSIPPSQITPVEVENEAMKLIWCFSVLGAKDTLARCNLNPSQQRDIRDLVNFLQEDEDVWFGAHNSNDNEIVEKDPVEVYQHLCNLYGTLRQALSQLENEEKGIGHGKKRNNGAEDNVTIVHTTFISIQNIFLENGLDENLMCDDEKLLLQKARNILYTMY